MRTSFASFAASSLVISSMLLAGAAASAESTPNDTVAASSTETAASSDVNSSPSASPSMKPIVRSMPAPKLFSISIVPVYQVNTGSDVNPKKSFLAPSGATALGFRAAYDITRRLTVYWNRSNPIALNGRYYSPTGSPVYGSLGLDINDSYGISYAVTKTLSIDAGYARRWRIGYPGAGDPKNSNPTFYSGAYIGSAWRFGPDTMIGKPFLLFGTAVDTSHHLNAAARAAFPGHGFSPRAPGWQIVCSTCGLGIRIPVLHQAVFVPRINLLYLTNYANSQIYPPIANAVEYGFDVKAAKAITYTVLVRNYNAHLTGYPYPAPQDQHYSYVNVSAVFRTRFALPK